MTDVLDEALALVDSEVERVREAWRIVLDADPRIVSVLIAGDKAMIAELDGKRARLQIVKDALDEHAANFAPLPSPSTPTQAARSSEASLTG